MSFNITVESGSSVRLPTAGKYCDRDIVITGNGGSGSGSVETCTVTIDISQWKNEGSSRVMDGYYVTHEGQVNFGYMKDIPDTITLSNVICGSLVVMLANNSISVTAYELQFVNITDYSLNNGVGLFFLAPSTANTTGTVTIVKLDDGGPPEI